MIDHHCQCIIPVFDGLLPEPHNRSILRLLFTCAHWHGLAKLRIHTDSTLRTLDEMTVSIGTEFRAFTTKTCTAFDTRELSHEMEARKRRQLNKGWKKSASNGQSVSGDPAAPNAQSVLRNEATSNDQVVTNVQPTFNRTSIPGSTDCRRHNPGQRRRRFNLKVYKYHVLGDYVKTIRRLGTTDSFSTEPVSN